MLGSAGTTSRMLKCLQWLVLLAFPVSCLPLLSHPFLAPFVIAGAVISMLACSLLFRNIHTISPSTFPTLLVVVMCVVMYFLRYVYFSYYPQAASGIQPEPVFKAFRADIKSLQMAYILTAFFFSLFCVVATFLLLRIAQNNTVPSLGTESTVSPTIVWIAFLLIVLLMLSLGYVAYIYRIGQMGVPPGPALPYRIKGLVFYGRLVVLPLLILYLIVLGTRLNDRWIVRSGVVLLLAHAVSDMFLRGSRSSLLLCALMFVFLIVSQGLKVRRFGITIFVMGGLTAIWMMPVIMNYRIMRFTSGDSIYLIMLQVLSSVGEGTLSQLFRGLNDLYLRLPGIETIWAMLSMSATPLEERLFSVINSSFGVTGYLNFDVYGIAPDWYTLFAPGYIGWWYLAVGWTGLAVGAVILALICVKVPRWIQLANFDCKPVANVFLLWMLFISMSDGTLDGNFPLIFSGIVILLFLEFWIRLVRKQPNRQVH